MSSDGRKQSRERQTISVLIREILGTDSPKTNETDGERVETLETQD
jgi:hypothetical protein